MTLQRHDTYITLKDYGGLELEPINVSANFVDENNDNVTEGTVAWTIYKEEKMDIGVLDNWVYGKLNNTTVADKNLILPSIIKYRKSFRK